MSVSSQNEDRVNEQEVPENIYCPNCGEKVSKQWKVKHGLSDAGYLHDDISMNCEECGHKWPHGVPINPGPNPVGNDLDCDACRESQMLVHRVDVLPDADFVLLHLKCPKCYYFKKTGRHPDRNGIALVGYPQITGELNMDKPDGFNPDKVDAETGEKSKDVSGLKKSFEKRLETNLESEEGGLPTSVEQEKVPIATNYPHSQVNESDIVVKDDDKIIGSASNFTLEDGVVYCDIEIKGTYFEENTTIVPVTDMEGIQYLIPTPVPVEESLQGNLAHNDTVSN